MLKTIIVLVLSFIATLSAIACHIFGITPNYNFSLKWLACGVVAMLALAELVRNRLKHKQLACMLDMTAMYIASSACGVIFSYVCAAASYKFPYADNWLLATDRLLGYNWEFWVGLVDRTPYAGRTLSIIYSTIRLQAILSFVYLIITKQYIKSYSFILIVITSMFACEVISGIFPAKTVLWHLNLRASDFGGYFSNTSNFVKIVEALRQGQFRELNSSNAIGIVTFPSFHASTCFIYGWVFWSSKWFRYPFFILNTLMALSALYIGGHYFSDVVAGILIAIIARSMVMMWINAKQEL